MCQLSNSELGVRGQSAPLPRPKLPYLLWHAPCHKQGFPNSNALSVTMMTRAAVLWRLALRPNGNNRRVEMWQGRNRQKVVFVAPNPSKWCSPAQEWKSIAYNWTRRFCVHGRNINSQRRRGLNSKKRTSNNSYGKLTLFHNLAPCQQNERQAVNTRSLGGHAQSDRR